MLYTVYWRNFGAYRTIGPMSKDHLTKNKRTTLCGVQVPPKEKVERLSIEKWMSYEVVSSYWLANQRCKNCFKRLQGKGAKKRDRQLKVMR